MRLGRSLYDAQGRVLLQRGMELRAGYLEKLKRYYPVIYVDDEISEGIELPEVISPERRLEMQRVLAAQWGKMQNSLVSEKVYVEPNFSRSLRQQMKDLLETLQQTPVIHEDLASLASYDNNTYVHSVNVAIYALTIGMALEFADGALIDLGVGAMLHDLGKIWVANEILNKQGALTPEEYESMKKHTEYGHNVLAKQPELSYVVAHCAYQHHERLNGSGYPRGLRGDDVHIFAQILAVADVYDAMVTHRPYRSGMAPADVMEYLYSRAGTEFSFLAVQHFGRKVAMYPVGSEVSLSDGRRAVVVAVHDELPARPVVRALQIEDNRIAQIDDIDLASTLNVTIVQSRAPAMASMD